MNLVLNTHLMKQNWPRIFAYSSFSATTGAVIYVFTHSFFQYVETGGIVTFLTYLGYIIIFGNMSYLLGRRFDAKALYLEQYPYVLGILLVVPTMIFIIYTPQAGVSTAQQPILFFTILVAALIGAYFGIRKGLQIRNHQLDRIRQGDDLDS